MKNLKMQILATILVGLMGSLVQATTISFLSADGLAGVDGDTTPWSADNSTVNLGTSSWSLLGGNATITGFVNGSPKNLTHRGFRGVGVAGQEHDEVDSHDRPERIEITFPVMDYYVNSIEVRSLFSNPDTGWSPGTEKGAVDFYLNGGPSFYTEYVSGIDALGTDVGDVVVSYVTPMLVDKLVFYVPTIDASGNPLDNTTIEKSEFAVAKLNVRAIPEPATICLLGLGALSLLRKRANKCK
jgi:hypothetical protein